MFKPKIALLIIFLAIQSSSLWAVEECQPNLAKTNCIGSLTLSNGNKYMGGFKDDLPDGLGVYFWKNGWRYEGQFKAGFRDGKGAIYNGKNEKTISGEWLKQNESFDDLILNRPPNKADLNSLIPATPEALERAGIISRAPQKTILDKARFFTQSTLPTCVNEMFRDKCYGFDVNYEGEFLGNKRYGNGLYNSNTGLGAVGQFKDNKIDGAGFFVYSNFDEFFKLLRLIRDNNGLTQEQKASLLIGFKGEWYAGNFKNDKRDGYGIQIVNGKILMNGQWSNDTFIKADSSGNLGNIIRGLANGGKAYLEWERQNQPIPVSPPANTGIIHFLRGQWSQNGNTMCKYDDGTVINIGIGICPLNR